MTVAERRGVITVAMTMPAIRGTQARRNDFIVGAKPATNVPGNRRPSAAEPHNKLADHAANAGELAIADGLNSHYNKSVKAKNPHARIDQINLAMDRLIAGKIRTNPALVEIAKD